MLYTQQFIIPENGILRIGTIGGEPYVVKDGNQYQVGYMVPPHLGLLHVEAVNVADERVLDCRVTVEGYSNRQIRNARVPGRVVVELPCSVTVTGPAGVDIIIEAWQVYGFSDRGAADSLVRDGADITGSPVPRWAQSFDFSPAAGPSTLSFRDRLGGLLGTLASPISNFSVPDGAATVDLSGADGSFIVFRQQG